MLQDMQRVNDDKKKVLSDQLEAILEYVLDVPKISQELHKVHATVNEINDRLNVVERVIKDH